jgi:hypothetical protein
VAGTDEDAPFSGRISARDADGDSLTYRIASAPSHGAVALDAATGAYTYTPAADWHGDDSFEVAVSDSQGGTTTTTVRMPVRPVADIADDSMAMNEDEVAVIDVNANDSFENADHAIIAIDGQSATAGTPVAVANGEVTLRANGMLDFQPTRDFHGPAGFSYTVTSGGRSETGNVAIDVSPVNDVPVLVEPVNPAPGQRFDPATGDHSFATPQDVSVDGQVNATDADGDRLAYTLAAPPQHGTLVLDMATGRYTYTPAAGYHGTDRFVVMVDDGHGGVVRSTVHVDVAAVEAPVPPAPTVEPPPPLPVEPARPAPAELATRPDHPFVRGPADVAGEPQRGGAPLPFESPVRDAADGAQSLAGTAPLGGGRGAVISAVNAVRTLDGTELSAVRGVVMEAVEAIDSLRSIDAPDGARASWGQAAAWIRGTGLDRGAETPVTASLHVGDDLALALSVRGDHAWLTATADGALRGLRVTLGDGRPVPAWVQVDPDGFVNIDRPAGVELLRLRVTVMDARGTVRSELIEIDFNAAELRRSADPSGDQQALPPPVPVPSFSKQLAHAVRPRALDAELLELLS